MARDEGPIGRSRRISSTGYPIDDWKLIGPNGELNIGDNNHQAYTSLIDAGYIHKEHYDDGQGGGNNSYSNPKTGHQVIVQFDKFGRITGVNQIGQYQPLPESPRDPNRNSGLLGDRGTAAELHERLHRKGYSFDHYEGTPDTTRISEFTGKPVSGMHQVGHVVVYKNKEGDTVKVTLIAEGQRSAWIPENERQWENTSGGRIAKIRDAGSPDLYEISDVVTV